MITREDQERVRQLITDAVTVLLKNGLNFNSQFSVEGLLGITLDEQEVFLVKVDETVKGQGDGQNIKSAPISLPQRTALTSPRLRGKPMRGGRPFSSARGRFPTLNRKRPLFGTPARTASQVANIPATQSSVQDDTGENEPPSKIRLQEDMTPNMTPADAKDPVIEIGDEDEDDDSANAENRLNESSMDGTSHVKQEPPDATNSSMPADSTQEPDSKYTLDGETSKSLGFFLDNLMTAHGTGSSNTSQAGSSSSPQLTSPKTEPMWEQQSSAVFPAQPGSSPSQNPLGLSNNEDTSSSLDTSEALDKGEEQSSLAGGEKDSSVLTAQVVARYAKPTYAKRRIPTPTTEPSSPSVLVIEPEAPEDNPEENGLINSEVDPEVRKLLKSTEVNSFQAISMMMATGWPMGSQPLVAANDWSNYFDGVTTPETTSSTVSKNTKRSASKDRKSSSPIKYTPSRSTKSNQPENFAIKDIRYPENTCRFCLKRCVNVSGLNLHVSRTHTDEMIKPYTCTICNKSFSERGVLTRHRKQVHLGIFGHHCKFCGKGFERRLKLDEHVLRYHPFTCQQCGLCCTSESALAEHVKEEHSVDVDQSDPGVVDVKPVQENDDDNDGGDDDQPAPGVVGFKPIEEDTD